MARKVSLVVVCEDILHGTFFRAFLYRRGFTRHQLRILPAPPGAGDAKRHVCETLRRELTSLRRSSRRSVGVIFVVDADNLPVGDRLRWVQDACRTSGTAPPADDEAVFGIVPKWEIENWLAYLRGEPVDEQFNGYEKYRRCESLIYPLVGKLSDMCDEQQLPDAPPSLVKACGVYSRFKRWRRNT